MNRRAFLMLGAAASTLANKRKALGAAFQGAWYAPTPPSNWQPISVSADGAKIFVPIWQGDYFYSGDTGADWTNQGASSGSRQWVIGGCSSDGSIAYGAVQGGGIYKYSSGTWSLLANQPIPVLSAPQWEAVRCSSDGSKVVAIIGSETIGDIWTSIDGGVTWVDHTEALSRNWLQADISGDGTKIIASNWEGKGPNGDGGVYISTNWQSGSPTWTANIFPANGSSFAEGCCYSRDGATAYCCFNANGLTSLIYISQDDGATWTAASPPTVGGNARNWNDVHCDAIGSVVVGIGYSQINNAWLSTNYGSTWTNLPILGGGWAALSDDGSVIATSTYGGNINISKDGGATWAIAPVHSP